MFLADAVVETHDRIVGRTYRAAVRTCETHIGNETAAVREALRSFADLGSALLGARDTGEALDAVIANGRIPDFPVTRSHPPASWPSAANSSIAGLIERPQEKNRVDALR